MSDGDGARERVKQERVTGSVEEGVPLLGRGSLGKDLAAR